MFSRVIVMLLIAFLTFSGCGGGGSGGSGSSSEGESEVTGVTEVEVTEVNQLKVTDVNGAPLAGASVSIASPVSSSVSLASSLAASFIVGDDGLVSIDGLGEGTYELTITIGGVTFITTVEIGAENYQETGSVATPVSIDETGAVTEVEAVIASISGTVVDTNNLPISNAQVSISAGAATNGAFASAITNANGAYTLLINVSKTLEDALSATTISASAVGYETQTKTAFEVLTNSNKNGVNFSLPSAIQETALYSEDFESDNSDWNVTKLSGLNAKTTWHVHTIDVIGINEAYLDGFVQLAVNDTSGGTIPAPKGSKCFWYGNGDVNDDAFGSFIDTISSQFYPLDGGSSEGDNSAMLVSPTIDLTNTSGAIKLTFDTYWEIESVNPNLSGFDLMTISVSNDDGNTWRDLSRLNPLSDPESTLAREPIPFSNTGFNSAPIWLTQESIPLVDSDKITLSGQNIKLKFTFQTLDGLFNGFRGWMIDNIKITQGVGTYPLVEDLIEYNEGGEGEINAVSASSSASTVNTRRR